MIENSYRNLMNRVLIFDKGENEEFPFSRKTIYEELR